MKKILTICAVALMAATLGIKAQNTTLTVHTGQGQQKIYKEIYGQFAEHLGSCIYGGLWVGPDSPIPNTDGYRRDVLEALQALKVPVLRWPGGCFADEYHWMNGIGPRDQRPSMKNNNWGGTIEDNSFGTHEFLNLCELLGCEPYISGNVGSGSVEELAKWVEYMTSEEGTPMANLRKQNGRERPWRVRFLGVGNESWGCGGSMRPEYYADLYRRYQTYCRDYDGNHLYKIASGASDYDYNWTRVLMHNAGSRMNGLSLHYYTVSGWNGSKGAATGFNEDDYYWTLGKCLEIEDVIRRHKAIMDEEDPRHRVALLVDEWGTWWDEEPGTTPGHLFQQNSMRDAMVAALTLNVFHRHTDRVRMANIAQIVNVLQSMILTDQEGTGHMALTPTYHVFQMYTPFQEATYLPVDLNCAQRQVQHNWRQPMDTTRADGFRTLPMVSASAAKTQDGSIVLSLVNVSLTDQQQISISLDDFQATRNTNVSGRLLTCRNIGDYNDFQNPTRVQPVDFNGARFARDGKLNVTLPARSIAVITIK